MTEGKLPVIVITVAQANVLTATMQSSCNATANCSQMQLSLTGSIWHSNFGKVFSGCQSTGADVADYNSTVAAHNLAQHMPAMNNQTYCSAVLDELV